MKRSLLSVLPILMLSAGTANESAGGSSGDGDTLQSGEMLPGTSETLAGDGSGEALPETDAAGQPLIRGAAYSDGQQRQEVDGARSDDDIDRRGNADGAAHEGLDSDPGL